MKKIEKNNRYIRKVTWIGLIVNLLLSGIKFIGGIAGNSQALIADAVHSLSDGITDIAIITGSYFWSNPPDDCHPYGHQRIETFITIFIGIILLIAGIGTGWHAVLTIQQKHASHPGLIALVAAAVSLVSKEVLFRWTIRAGKKAHSTALTANAWHHRLDALSSIPAFLAVGGTLLFPQWTFLDHVGAIIISVFILQAAIKILWPGVQELLEKGASSETLDKIKNIINQHSEVIQAHRIRTRYLGSNLQLDFHLVVNGESTVKEGHDIAGKVKSSLMAELPDMTDVVIHIEPDEAAK